MDTQRNTARRAAARAFTLIEVLLVIVIIGMLATVLIVTVGGQSEGARIDTTRLSLQKITTKIEEYNVNCGSYPNEAVGGIDALMTKPSDETIAQNWRGPYVREAELKDAWGVKVNYELKESTDTSGSKFSVWSNGPDKQSGTEDDVYPDKDEKKTTTG